jgi:hypothetical protein
MTLPAIPDLAATMPAFTGAGGRGTRVCATRLTRRRSWRSCAPPPAAPMALGYER